MSIFMAILRTPAIGYFNSVKKHISELNHIQTRNYAARKGTREKRRKEQIKIKAKQKAKAATEKSGFIPPTKAKTSQQRPKRRVDESNKRDPVDNVFVQKYFRLVLYPFAEAVACHRETHHPDMYNQPNANLHVTVELNMQGEKKTRFVDNFTRLVAVPHKFDHGEERSVVVFSKSQEMQNEVLDAGAALAGGVDLIKKVQNGQLSLQDFNFVVAHPDILPELVVLRGLLKRKFPNPKAGTIDVNLKSAVERLLHGIKYSALKDEHEKDFGTVETIIGTLNMETSHLEENFANLVNDIHTMRPKRAGSFIYRCLLWSPPSREKLKTEYEKYLVIDESKSKEKPQDDEEEVEKMAL